MAPGGVVRRARARARAAAVRLRARLFPAYVRKKAFSDIYDAGGWRGESNTASGTGSTLDQTSLVRQELPRILKGLGARSLLDAPCGDFHWMQSCELDIDEYVGVDIVPDLIQSNISKFGTDRRRFLVADIAKDDLPASEVVLCRDCLVHLSFRDAQAVIRNFRRSGAAYLLATTFTERQHNTDLGQAGGWRPLNLMRPPFGFPAPLLLLNEGCTEYGELHADKSLGLWRLGELPA